MPAYRDSLIAEDVYGAFVEGQLVGTAAWHVSGDDGRTARISSVFVDPMFGRLGIGGRLLGEVESRGSQSGFHQLGISATINAVPFFEKLGYREASRGIKALGPDCSLPVAFLRKSALRGQGTGGLTTRRIYGPLWITEPAVARAADRSHRFVISSRRTVCLRAPYPA